MTATTAPQKNLVTHVSGKVLRVRRYDDNFYTSIICPALDEYSKPSVIEVRSKDRFCDSDEKISNVLCMLGGYEGKAYRVTDRDTGEQRSITPINLFLELAQ